MRTNVNTIHVPPRTAKDLFGTLGFGSGASWYCTTCTEAQVIVLAVIIDRKTTERAVQRLLLNAMSTLEVSSRPITSPMIRNARAASSAKPAPLRP